MRSGAKHYTHSKLMAWVAYDRAVKSVEDFGLSGPVEELEGGARQDPRGDPRERLEREAARASCRPMSGEALDAALLMIPTVGFLPPDDPRVVSTVDAIQPRPDGGRPYPALPHGRERGRRQGTRRLIPRLQLLARRRAFDDRPPRRGARPFRAAAFAPERSRPAGGGIRPARQAAARQFPAGLLACRPGQHGEQPDLHRRPRRAARRGSGAGAGAGVAAQWSARRSQFHDLPARGLRVGGVVGDEKHRQAVFPRLGEDQLAHLCAQRHVEARERLVEDRAPSGRASSVRISATRAAWPPDSVAGSRLPKPSSPTSASAASTARRRAAASSRPPVSARSADCRRRKGAEAAARPGREARCRAVPAASPSRRDR